MLDLRLLLLLTLGVLAYGFVHASLLVLGHRLRTELRRHQIIYDARKRRQEYFNALAQRAAAVSGGPASDEASPDPTSYNVDIVDDSEAGDAPLARAA